MKLLTPLFNAEIRRIAREEKKTGEESMRALMEEIAALCSVRLRAVYHWRSGRHGLPAECVPALCQRFGSNALLDEMNRLRCVIDIPEQYDLALLATRSVRQDMELYEEILSDFESDGIQPGELQRLHELAARAHRNIHHLVEIAEADCERRMQRPARKANRIVLSAVRSSAPVLRKKAAR